MRALLAAESHAPRVRATLMRCSIALASSFLLTSNALAADPDSSTSVCIVSGVAEDDVLNLRAAPGASNDIVGELPPGTSPVVWLGPATRVGRTDWLEVRYEQLTGWASARFLVCGLTPEKAEAQVGARAREVVGALAHRDMTTFARYVHPKLGVRFSPYANVEPMQDVLLRADQIPTAFADDRERLWGHFDGTGDAIEMTFAEYFDAFVYNRDYADVPDIAYNRRIGIGNTIDNTLEVYGKGVVVEYFSPGNDPEGMSWSSLRIVFMQHDGVSFVVGLIHDQWTI